MTSFRFDEFEAFVASIEDADLRMMLPRLGRPHWEINSFSVGELHVQYGREGSGNITEGSSRTGGQVIFFPITGVHRANGVAMHDRSVFVMRPGSDFTISVHEAHEWCSVFLPWQLPGNLSRPATQSDVFASHCRVVDLKDRDGKRLQWVLTRLASAIAIEPNVLVEPASLRSIRRDLMTVCQPVTAVDSAQFDEVVGRPRLPRRDLLRVVHNLIEQSADGGLSVEDLAAATGVSDRTLRSVFVEFYGVPPSQYLVTLRLHRVRAALRAADRWETTVTAIAAKFGFWHFGRFATAYRRVFGELPSQTLSSSIRHGRPPAWRCS